MIAMRDDVSRERGLRSGNAHAIGELLDLDAKPSQILDHGADAIAFLHA